MQRAIWELGMELHLNESETAESIKKAKAIYSQVTMDTQALCFSTIKEAKVKYIWTMKEPKATHTCTIQEAKTTCSAAIRDAENQGASQAKSLHRQHAKAVWDLEEQVILEEGRSQADFLSTCQATIHASPVELKGMLVASYHLLMGQAPMSLPFTLLQRGLPNGATICPSSSSHASAWAVPQAQKATSFPRPVDRMPLGGTTSKTTSEGPPAPSSERSHFGTRYPSRATWKYSARTLTWWRRLGGSISKGTPTPSLWRAPASFQKSLGEWLRVLSY